MDTNLTTEEKEQIRDYLESKGLPTETAVTFNDVALLENFSNVRSRAEINDFSVDLGKNISLGIPVVSANMETVTGLQLAVALEREGGLGLIPQALNIDERLDLLEKIKRADSTFIEHPLTAPPDQTLEQAKETMNKYNVHSLIIVNKRNEVVGILSTRDWKHEKNLNRKIRDLMTSKVITAPLGTSFAKAKEILLKHKIEKLPLLDKKKKLAGLLTSHGLFYSDYYPRSLRDGNGNFITAGTIGVGRSFDKKHMDEVRKQVEAGIKVLLIDTARAFSVNTKEAIEAVKAKYPDLLLIAGNVSTAEGAKFLFESGADVVKVNQGRGHACRTSEIGIGMPQITAIAETSVIAKKYGKKIIADGGMKGSGDMIKAIAAGADALMSGFLLIGTQESAAPMYYSKQGLPVKNYEGSASFHAQLKRIAKGNLDHIRRAEGVTEEVNVYGTVNDFVTDVLNAFRSAMSYQGVHNLKELQEKSRFRLQTKAGLFEGIKKPVS